MSIENIQVLRVPASPGIDPITVFIEEHSLGAASLTIRCYGTAWAAYFGAMGCGAVEFISSIGAGYLANKMASPEMVMTNKKARDQMQRYTERVALAVINHCRTMTGKELI